MKQIWIVYANTRAGERCAVAAYSSYKRAALHVDRCIKPMSFDDRGVPLASPAELLDIYPTISSLTVEDDEDGDLK